MNIVPDILIDAIKKIVEDQLVRSKTIKQSDEIAKRFCSDNPKDLISAFLASGVADLDEATKKTRIEFTRRNLIDHYGNQKLNNLDNTYSQFFNQFSLLHGDIEKLYDVDKEWFFIWQEIASNAINEEKQKIIGKIGAEKFINNADISVSTLIKLGNIDSEILEVIYSLLPYVSKQGIILVPVDWHAKSLFKINIRDEQHDFFSFIFNIIPDFSIQNKAKSMNITNCLFKYGLLFQIIIF
jgi:hypothetical protein